MDIESKKLYNKTFIIHHKLYKFIKEITENDAWLVLKSSGDILYLNKLTDDVEESYNDAVENIVLLGARLLGIWLKKYFYIFSIFIFFEFYKKNIPLKRGGEKTVEVELVELIIDKSPVLAIIIVVCIFSGKYIKSFIKEYRALKNEKDARERAEDQALIQEGREFGHIESERDAYKTNSKTLKEEYYKQQVKINELDKQVNDLTHIVRVESEERKKDGERLDSLIRIHDNLSKNYSEMGESLKKSLSEMGEALNQFQFNNRKMHEKITDMEDDISSIKNDVKELKEIQTQEEKK